jgi:hypothetical protein
VSFGCSGAPIAATCTVSPTAPTLDGSTPVEVTVTATTTARSMAAPSGPVRPPGLGGRLAAPWFLWLLAMLAAAGVATRKRAAWGFAMTLLCAFMWVACGGGGGSPSPQGTPAGTYTLTVTGTFTTSTGTMSHNTALTLKVQ